MKKIITLALTFVLFATAVMPAIAPISEGAGAGYDLTTYTLPYWEGDTVYNETVYPLENPDGSISPVTLMYDIDRVISVRDATLATLYTEGVDYTVTSDGKLNILKSGRINTVPYGSYYPGAASSSAMERRGGGYVFFSEGSVFHRAQIAVTYVHSDTWRRRRPESKADLLPRTVSRLENGQSLSVVFFGDSVTFGCNASGLQSVSSPPYMPLWCDMTVAGLKKNYSNNNITSVNTAVGGTTSEWGVTEAPSRVVSYNPDLVFIGFGTNDGTAGVAASVFKSNIKSIIDTVRQGRPACEFVILSPFFTNPETFFSGAQESYLPVIEELENEYSGVASVDVMTLYKELMSRKKYADMTGNNVNHPNDFYIRYYAQSLLTLLSPFDIDVLKTRSAETLRAEASRHEYRDAERAEVAALIAEFEETVAPITVGKAVRNYLKSTLERLKRIKTAADYEADELDRRELYFDSEASLAAITYRHSVDISLSDGAAKVRCTADDPYFRISYPSSDIDIADYGYAVIVYRVPEGVTNTSAAQVFVVAGGDTGESELRSAFFERTHGDFAYVVIDLGAIYGSGILKSIRIDPFVAFRYGDEFFLHSVSLFGTENNAKDFGDETTAALNRKPRHEDVVTLSPAELYRITPQNEYLWVGDADGNGLLTISDLQSLKKYVAGSGITVRPEICDCSGDGLVTISDLASLKLILAGCSVASQAALPLASVTKDQSLSCARVTRLGDTGMISVDVSDKDIPAGELASVSAVVSADAGSNFTFTVGGVSAAATVTSGATAPIAVPIDGASGEIDGIVIEFDAESFSLVALMFSYK